MRDWKNKKFTDTYRGANVTVGYNQANEASRDEKRLVFLNTVGPDFTSEHVVLSRDEATALRNHLSDLLGITDIRKAEPEPVETTAPDEAVQAMQELAHQMSLFYTDDLADALNRHAAALEGFNK